MALLPVPDLSGHRVDGRCTDGSIHRNSGRCDDRRAVLSRSPSAPSLDTHRNVGFPPGMDMCVLLRPSGLWSMDCWFLLDADPLWGCGRPRCCLCHATCLPVV